ncbi:PadR family transcriptional regulator [Streptococcus caviae]|uniref:PadR family transcriptional regulator n=1 Tax=Streptococcus sp. 'caviae' TaxID=1915004 RepID=UPI00094B951C|nr:PadR family transcriptional regulator [Streptococcus sp. 'caviae']OLN82530.1 PadR family transcriptional regulator [Streptococcus sp. 'caviae']
MAISLTEQLILGILLEGPQHGYHIEQIIKERGMRKWTDVGFSSIYYVLDKLEKKGLAAATSSKGKEKKEYQITKEGLEILKRTTQELISECKPANAHLMTGLATAYLLDGNELRAAFSKRKEKLETELADMQNKKENGQHETPIAQQLFSLGETLLKAELDWLKQEVKKLEG